MKFSKLKFFLGGLCALVLTGALLSCVVDDKDDDKDDTTEFSVKVTPESTEIASSGSVDLSAVVTVVSAKNNSPEIKWEITGDSEYAELSAKTGERVTLTGKNTKAENKSVTVKATAAVDGIAKTAAATITVTGTGSSSGGEGGGTGGSGESGGTGGSGESGGSESGETTYTLTFSGSSEVDEANYFTASGISSGKLKVNSSGNIVFTTSYAATVTVTSVYSHTTANTTSQWGIFKGDATSATVSGPVHNNTSTTDNTEYEESVELSEAGTYKIARISSSSKEFFIYKVVVTEVSGSSGSGSGGSGGSGSGGTSGTTPAPEGNVIKASDIPLGFAGVNSGFASIGATSYSKGSYSNPVTTRADLVKAVSAGGIIYISGMIDMSDEGTGSKLPAVGAKNTDVSSVMDSWISSKTSGKYTTYKDWITAYSGAVGKSTDDKKLGNNGNSALASTLWTLNNAWKSVIQLNIKSNTILIGLGSNSGIRGGTISINGVSNVAIRNLYLVDAIDMFPHHEKDDGYNSQFDCITVQGSDVKNIWIDHCTFEDTMVMQHVTNGLDSSDEKWQNYDGSCDIKGDAAGVTVSNCHFFKHDKTMLIGSADDEGSNTVRKISLINNYFDSCVQRLPMVRNSQIHILNNYYEFDKQYTVGDGNTKMSYAIGVRNGSVVYSEANYFGSNMNYPYDGDSKTKSTSKIYIKGDVAAKSGSEKYTVLSSAPFTPSYSYSAKTADDAKAYVLENAGHGKWTVQQ